MTKTIADFIGKKDYDRGWGTEVERERKNRIRLALAAYAYEIRNEIIMSDPEFDALSLKIDPSINTGRADLDKFFRDVFDPSTGMWIRQHPELNKIEALYDRLYGR